MLPSLIDTSLCNEINVTVLEERVKNLPFSNMPRPIPKKRWAINVNHVDGQLQRARGCQLTQQTLVPTVS